MAAVNMFTRVVFNLQCVNTRKETLEGKEYLVVPAIMLTPGVHTGSEGPLLYTSGELSKFPTVWNYKPVTLYHPIAESGGISACDPGVIERQKIGLIMNSQYVDNKLKCECWLDEAKMRTSVEGAAVLNAVANNQMVEVSTGLYKELENSAGLWGNEQYNGVIRNIRPDHLAILLDQTGACSIKDGAGLLRNESEELSHEDIREQIRGLVKDSNPIPCEIGDSDYCYVADVFPKYAVVEKSNKMYKVGYKVKKGKVSIETAEPEEVRKVTTYVTANGQMFTTTNDDMQGPVKLPKPSASQLSPEMRDMQFKKTLEEKYSGIQQEGDWGGWTTELFANYAIFAKDGKYLRLPYTYDDDMIRFDGGVEDVERVTEYRTKKDVPLGGTTDPPSLAPNYNMETNMGKPVLNTPPSKTLIIKGTEAQLKPLLTNAIHQGAHAAFHEPDTMQHPHNEPHASDGQTRTLHGEARKGQVDSMIKGGHAKEEERSMLENLPDDHFEKIHGWAMRGATQPIVPYSYDGIGDRSNAPHGTHNVASLQDWLATAPADVREMVVQNMAEREARKDGLIRIICNANPRFNPAYLKTLDYKMLQGMASLARPQQQSAPTANYSGQGDVPMFLESVTNNGDQVVENMDDEVLHLPTMYTPKVG